MHRECTVTFDKRELATVMAALRFHQDENLQSGADIADKVVKDIATDSGSFEPLDIEQVGRLCERLNIGHIMHPDNYKEEP